MSDQELLYDKIEGKAFKNDEYKFVITKESESTLKSMFGRDVKLPKEYIGKVLQEEKFQFFDRISIEDHAKYSELKELLEGVDSFSKAMKERILQKSKEGYTGWKECSLERAEYEASQRLARIRQNGEETCDIGVANWMAIHWLNRRK